MTFNPTRHYGLAVRSQWTYGGIHRLDEWLFDWAFIPARRRRLVDALAAAEWNVVERDSLLKEWGGSGQNFWRWGWLLAGPWL